jgi:hypothetical protein
LRGLAAALAAVALPAAGAAGDALWYLQVDNDVPFSTDRWYTSGVRIARVKEGIEWGVVQEIYTPEAKKWRPGVSDRLPTARLLASFAWHEIGPGMFQTLELMAGVRGPAAGGRATTQAIHHLIAAPFVDWSREPDNAFDGTLVAVRSMAWGGFRLHYGAQAGTQLTFAHAGAEWRWGEGASRLLRFGATPDIAPGLSPWSAFAGASVRGVARNELLSGNYDPNAPPISRRKGVARAAAGFAWRGSWGALTFEIATDTREFDAQRVPHAFGSLALQASF